MGNENPPISMDAFLSDDRVQQYFADVNIWLLSGKHIGEEHYAFFSLLTDKAAEWTVYYKDLYKLNLVMDQFDGHPYYYLDFFDTAKSKFADKQRHRELTEVQTLVGLVLLDMYYKKYFDEYKLVRWADFRQVILESEQNEAYQQIFFSELRPTKTYDPKEWASVHRKINSAIDLFDRIGWVEKQPSAAEEVPDFIIKPSLLRLAKLYDAELKDFNGFVLHLQKEDPA